MGRAWAVGKEAWSRDVCLTRCGYHSFEGVAHHEM